MNRPFIIHTRKRGLKRWQNAGTLHNTKTGAERTAKGIIKDWCDLGVPYETKTRRMTIQEHKDGLSARKRMLRR